MHNHTTHQQHYNPQPIIQPELHATTNTNPEGQYRLPNNAMNMALALMAKAFKLNYSTPTNNNQRISSNPRNRQIAQPGMNMGQDRQMRMVGANGGNQFRQYAGQNVGYQNGYNAVQNVGNQVVQDAVQNQGVQNIGNQNGQIGVQNIGNGNVVAARAEGNAPGNNGNQIRCYNCRGLGHLARNCTVRPRRRDAAYLQTQLLIAQKEEAGIQLQAEEFDLMAAAADLDEIEEVNANCILMANLQQASTSGTQTDKAPVYDSDGSAEVHNYDNCYDNEIFNMFTQEEQYTEILEPIPEPHQVQQNDNVISDISGVEQEGGTVDQHTATVEETRAYFESLYNNLALEVEKVNSVNRKLKETNADLTTELARYKNQEKCFEISQEKYDKLERCYQKSVYQEQCLTKKINALHLSSGKQITTLNEEISNLSKQLSTEKSTVSSLLEEKKKLKSDFKIREDELLDKQIQLENKIKELDNILVKMGQSIQTMHMLSPKPDSFYHTEQKMALGYQNPFYLKQAQRKHQCLYDGKVLLEKHDPPVVHDSEETLQLAQESRQKMKQLNKEIKPANYTKINHLSGVFVSQTAKSQEEVYLVNTSKMATVSKSISIPNEEFLDDTTLSVARKFLNEVKSTIVTLQRVVKHRMTLDTHNWSSIAHQEIHKILKEENFPIINQVDTRLQNFEIQFLKEAAKFVRDFKSLAKEADESLAKHKTLELEIERLLRAVVSQDIMSIVQNPSVVDSSNLQTELDRTKERLENCIIKKENEYAKLWNDWYKKCEECKYDKISYDKAYNDMQQKIERLQAQLGDQKGKSQDTPCVSNTLDPLSQKLENENVELEFQVRNYEKEIAHLKTTYKNLFDSISVTRAQTKTITDSLQNKLHDTIYENAKLRAQLFDKVSDQVDTTKGTSTNTKFANQKVDETNDLSKPVTSNSVPTPQESKSVKHDNVIAPGMFRINPFKPSREEKYVPNKVRASVRTTPITVSQPHVVTKKDVNSDSNGLSSTGVDNTAKTRRPQPRSNTKNDRNKEKHMSSECKHVKLDIRNDKSEVVCAMCKQCLLTANHDVCMLNYVNAMNSRGKKQKAHVSNTENQKKQKPKVIKPKNVGSKERLASPKPSKPRFCLRWSPTGRFFDIKGKIIASSESESQSDCSNGDNACTSNPSEPKIKRFPNSTFFLGSFWEPFALEMIMLLQFNFVWLGFGDLQWGNILITRVYFVEGLGHNLFSVGQFCDSDLEVAFRRNTCFVRTLEGVDLLKGNRSTNLYTINLHEMASASPICLMARATSTKSWLWHQRLSHLNFDTINDLAKNDLVTGLPKFKYHKEHLCPSCEQGKSKRASHPPKPVPNSKQRLHLLHMDLCGPMRIASINGKRYVLVIVDDYSRYTWVHFLRSKDEAPEVIKTFLKRITVLLQSPVIIIRTDNGTEFKNQILKEYFDSVGISHQASSVRTPQQNGVVERRNRTLVEAARTMLIFSRAPLFLWAEAIATACYTQNRSIIHRRFNKTPYELINGRKPDISFLHVFGALCYPKNDREDIGKLGAKGDIGFFIGYSADSCAYRVYNRRTKKIMETMNVTFDELSAMAFEQSSSKPGPQSMTSGQISSGLDLTYAPSTITTQKPTEGELDLLFEAMYDDYIGGQPSSAPRTAPDAQAPQALQTPTATTTTADTAPTPTNSSSQATNCPNSSQDVDELETQQHGQHQPATIADNVPNAMFDENTFVNPFATPSTSDAESSSSQYVDPSNMHTFYQPYPHEFQWTKDHPLEQVIGEPSRPVLTRNQLRSDGDMCMYALTVSTVEPKNVKEAMTDPAWIESMQEELLQFKRLDCVNMRFHDVIIPAPPPHVYKLKKALYGLKQAPRAWYDELSKFLLQNHFFKGTIDPTLFIRRFDDDILVVQVYVDDIIFGSTHPSYQSPRGIFINQSNYVLEILKKYGMEACDPLVDATKYRSMIGALMYLTSSRPDIVHATCLCARYQAKPTEKHLKEVKRIFRYLRGTVNTGLWYTKDSGFELTGFSDAGLWGCKDTFMSYLCYRTMAVTSTRSKSTVDSKSAIAISANKGQHSRTKHIVVRYHFIKEHVEKGTIELYFVKTDYQLADLFTKALPVDRFNYLVRRLGMRSLSPQELDRLAKSQ
ncbi:retrovirus-related pol polyprotein from transposon TNT 1-94 [Tanacetum coccineum]|uniref:Retrovirus-related pol polyprotein from transposon TNT 1-94 n=1 Tax=Tanacetum coccineum TaxID=301880 RepID=A0ABQ4YWB7_9ASTR